MLVSKGDLFHCIAGFYGRVWRLQISEVMVIFFADIIIWRLRYGGGALILEVDDNDAIREIVDVVLSSEGYVVVTAASGEQAMQEIERRLAEGIALPRLVLLDLTMPGMSGYQTLQALRQLPGGDRVPVIFISALSECEERATALAAGGVDYLSKPFQIPKLIEVVARHTLCNVVAFDGRVEA